MTRPPHNTANAADGLTRSLAFGSLPLEPAADSRDVRPIIGIRMRLPANRCLLASLSCLGMHLPSIRIAGQIHRYLWTALLAILLTSCLGSEKSTSATRYVSTDSAGVQVAVTHWNDPSPAVGWTIGSVPRVTFGETGAEPVDFYEIDDAVRLSDGRVVVLDRGTKELLYFSRAGELQARAGGAGDGPGEFREPAGLAQFSGDTIAVYARRSQHLSLFERGGAWLLDRPIEKVDGLLPTRDFRLADVHDGSLILHNPTSFYVLADMEEGPINNPNYRFATDGAFEGTVGEPSTMWIHPTRVLFDGARITDAADGQLYIKDAARYEIRVYDYDGGLLRIHRLIRPAQPTSEEDLDRYKAFLRRDIPSADLVERLIAGVERSRLADSFPAIRQLYPDVLGNVWVEEYHPPWSTESSFGVFAANGPWLGTIAMPADFRPLQVGADFVLGVHIDELDVQHLVLYDLER